MKNKAPKISDYILNEWTDSKRWHFILNMLIDSVSLQSNLIGFIVESDLPILKFMGST